MEMRELQVFHLNSEGKITEFWGSSPIRTSWTTSGRRLIHIKPLVTATSED